MLLALTSTAIPDMMDVCMTVAKIASRAATTFASRSIVSAVASGKRIVAVPVALRFA